MYIDFEFYKSIYNGSKLNEDNFPKFIEKAESIISEYTWDRVNQITINNFPQTLIDKIKQCGCELADTIYDIDRVNNMYLLKDDGTSGVIKSQSAGAVSISYENGVSSYLSNDTVQKKYQNILSSWLYPQKIGGTYYNLMSWVSNVQTNCNFI